MPVRTMFLIVLVALIRRVTCLPVVSNLRSTFLRVIFIFISVSRYIRCWASCLLAASVMIITSWS